MILIAQNVRQHGEAVAILDQAHGNARDVCLHRHAGIHQPRQPAHTDAIELEPFDSVISTPRRIE